jgi:hypothetical protein
MIRFMTNQKGRSNVQDTNCYLYKVSKVTAATDRTYWKYVAKERDSCRATAITVTSTKEIYTTGGETGKTGREGERCICCPPPHSSTLGAISVSVENKMPGFAAFISNRHNMNQAFHKEAKIVEGLPVPGQELGGSA